MAKAKKAAAGQRSEQLTPAVAYVRKSSRGQAKGRERQEKSIEQQRREIAELAKAEGCCIVRWYEDAGISGWKRDAQRPGFAQMLRDAQECRDFTAVIVDDLDRFTRADYLDAFADINSLSKAGIERIISAQGGTYRIDRTDAGEAHRLLAIAMASHEYSRKLSRRVTLARRNAAVNRKRTGGRAPYGYELDGSGGLKKGDPKQIKIVRWLFEQLATKTRSLNSLAAELNCTLRDKNDKLIGKFKTPVPCSRGGKWAAKIIAQLVRNPVYKGTFRYGEKHVGEFYGHNANGEVVEASKINGQWKKFVAENCFPALVDPKLYDRVIAHLATLAGDRSRRKRQGYALTGVLYCQCGSTMYGSFQDGRVSYKCSKNFTEGKNSCGYQRVREDLLLPFVLRLLGEERDRITEMLSVPPEELRRPRRSRMDDRKQLQKERDQLAARITRAERNLLEIDDPRTRKSLDGTVSEWRDQLDVLDAQLATATPTEQYTREEAKNWLAWWEDFDKNAVSVPVKGGLPRTAHLYQDPESEESAVLIDKRVVNAALCELGAKVQLYWTTEKTKYGQNRHRLVKGRFQLGQKSGRIPKAVLEPTAIPESIRGRARI